ncbi:MAG: penicillin-binding transpeptidase domain-containing protein [Pyrinomonadaceae bacterium]
MVFSSEKLRVKLVLTALFSVLVLFSGDLSAQTKKTSNQRKNQTSVKNDSKNQAKNSASKPDKSAKAKPADLKKQTEAKRQAAIEQAKRQAAAEARRQMILAEQRRRAEIAREAELRRIAFERGLRAETTANISNDNTDGEDLEVRRAALNALGNHAGTIVVLEPQTGRVLSIVNQDWAIRKSFKPCSTIKLVTAVAGLNENVITADGNIRNRNFPLNLDDAIAFSNNSYFQAVGRNLGNEKMLAYAKMLGLGQPTGINAENETGGRIAVGNNNARIYSHGDDFEVTPLQLGVIVSAITNGGKIIIPQIPRTKFEKSNFRGAMRYQLNLPNDTFQNIIPGMIGAAAYGTAHRGMDSTLEVAGKTGTCIGQGSWLGLFASVAPIENPKLAVIVITRGQAERGKIAAAIAGNVYESLKYRLVTRGGGNLAKIPLELRPQTKVNAKVAAQIDALEGEDSDDNDAAVKPAPKKSVKKTEKSADLFRTIVVKVKKSNEITRPRIAPNN